MQSNQQIWSSANYIQSNCFHMIITIGKHGVCVRCGENVLDKISWHGRDRTCEARQAHVYFNVPMNIYATGLPASAFNHLEIIVPSVQSVCLWPWPLHITHHLWLLPTHPDLHCICCYSKNKISLRALKHFTILCLPSTSRKKADWKAFSQHIRFTLPAIFGPLGQYKPLEILDFGFESSEG